MLITLGNVRIKLSLVTRPYYIPCSDNSTTHNLYRRFYLCMFSAKVTLTNNWYKKANIPYFLNYTPQAFILDLVSWTRRLFVTRSLLELFLHEAMVFLHYFLQT